MSESEEDRLYWEWFINNPTQSTILIVAGLAFIAFCFWLMTRG